MSVLKVLLARDSIPKQTKILLLLAQHTVPVKPATIVELARRNGLRGLTSALVSAHLNNLRNAGKVVSLPDGWEILPDSRLILEAAGLVPKSARPTAQAEAALAEALMQVRNSDALKFLTEAVGCIEAGYLRAGVVLSWVGAVSILHDLVIQNHLPAFNAEAISRKLLKKPAKTADDISQMKEYSFLEVLHAISVIGKNVKDDLQQCLKWRNGCGHPNSYAIGPAKVNHHIEILALHVFSKL